MKKQKSKNIRSKMMGSYMVIVLVCALASVIALGMLWNIGSKLTAFYNENYVITVEAWNARYIQEAAKGEMLAAMLEEDTKKTLDLLEQSKTYLDEIGKIVADLKENYRGDTSEIDAIEQMRLDATASADEIIKFIGYGAKNKAYPILQDEYLPKINEMSSGLEKVAAEQENGALEKVNQVTVLTIISVAVTLLVTVVGAVLATRKGTKIADSISTPIQEIERASRQLAQGKLNVEISYNDQDELGSLAESMRAACSFMQNVIADTDYMMKEMSSGNFAIQTKQEEVYAGDFRGILISMHQLEAQLRSAMGEIHEYSTRVAMGAQQLAEGAQSLAEGTMDQTSAVSGLKEMLGDITESSKNAVNVTEQSYGQAMQFQTIAETGRSEMDELLKAMDAISETSGQIEKIITEIEDIAEQTNLLSLNASIEAARAGESGRGFAVVADQIGRLAAESAQSAVHTRQLIQNTMAEISNGNEITRRTSETLVRVVDGINMLADQVKNVNEGVAEQAGFVKRMESGVERIAEVIEMNAASAQESSATSEELSAQAENLETLVGKFKI